MNFQVIVTLGPSLNNAEKLKKINSIGDCIFRINGAHVTPEQLPDTIQYVRGILPDSKIMVDLPGNKVRTANLSTPIPLVKGENFEISTNRFNFKEFYKYVKVGDVCYANDSIYKLEVMDVNEQRITFKSHSDGALQTNKGVQLKGINAKLPFLFKRDSDLIKAASEYNADIISLSFVRTKEDILEVKNLLKEINCDKLKIFTKIETALALENLETVMEEVDVANVDRGDLSADIGFYALPAAQEKIINTAKAHKKPIFLATQFMKNMETHPVPLISEVMDLNKTLAQGISGIQLSEETAVGKYSVECVETVFNMYKTVQENN